MEGKRRVWPLSTISTLHYVKLVFRSGLFLAAAYIYIINRVRDTGDLFGGFENSAFLLNFIWLVFAVEMVLRFFPSKFESMGCQKQFAANYIAPAAPPAAPPKSTAKSTFAVAAFWLALNGGIGALYLVGIFDRGIMLLISLAYSICDMICILFFCPFQTWVMKNKCCGSCRIYNWDYAMMFTPLVFVRGVYTWSLLALALGLLAEWEIIHLLHPERFCEATNEGLACANCEEKLCRHKKQLQRFLEAQRAFIGRELEELKEGKK